MNSFIRKFIYAPLLQVRRRILKLIFQRKINKQIDKHKKNLERIKGKEKVSVAFFALQRSVWKYDYLYRLMVDHPKFEPVIIVCPIVNYGMENMLIEMRMCYDFFSSRNYKVRMAYNPETQEYLDIKKEINPDIIFYTNPYKGLIDNRYYITEFSDVLTCYVSYNYGNSCLYDMFHNLPLHNLVWRFYAETEEHRKYSQEYADNKGQNIIVTGYPGIDAFIDSQYTASDVWKIKDSSVKRIIWAPHHTIDEKDRLSYSCFLRYANFMFEVAKKYEDLIQIAFKPHPLLRVKLNRYWGEDKTTQYYESWGKLPNCFLVDNDYIDLFLTSDAMIHDSGSFITEYLYTKKPVLRTDNGRDLSKEFNPFALNCLSMYYYAYSESDIEEFVRNVINGDDILRDKRNLFYKEKLLPPNNQLASCNILEDLLSNIN